ncbi:LacI family DNA-binding transcriptional regulator [Thermoanaerobacterium thermosaccharolyticum]|uniref:LacI family DNA-binding transcriptional regulator n=1 Tax=Thermoanaerobacterium thermosaccharolyticum TaxID=1517 RepID=UPI00123B545A|nr:LacI family DNA-binding transcriptional regulator [Thermoanaerobacterium thermosaccharolyticum]KAA5806273.1 LacI family transcriptional regulator [Thermoanaerobacterium thermosaccharolyticum]
MNATIKDVAREAKVSIATVSRVLNNSAVVTDETKQRVLDAIKKTGYKPNALARSLKIQKTHTIGLIVPDISSPFYPEVVRGIEDIASMYSYNIFLCNTDQKEDKEMNYIEILSEKQVDGIIYMGDIIRESVKQQLHDIGIPIVLAGTEDAESEFPNVNIDNKKASYDAVKYLLSLGHKKIGMISGPSDDPIGGVQRTNGYKEALSEAKIRFKPSLVVEGNFKARQAYLAMLKLLENNVDAVFAASDEMAAAAINAIFDSGFSVPEDIHVIGFDNTYLSYMFRPTITTIQRPAYDIGAVSMRLMTKLLAKEPIDDMHVILPHQLIVRESTGYGEEKK